jgi:Fe-S cluster assembly protein SufD
VNEGAATAATPAPAEWVADLGPARIEHEPEAVRALRARGLERFSERGFPRPHEEEWRFTNVAPVARTRFARPPAGFDAAATARALAPARLAACHEVVFVDGRHVPELSGPGGSPPGVVVRSLARARGSEWDAFGAELGRRADIVTRPFAALSTALFEDGAVVEIARGATVETPIHLIFWNGGHPSPTAVFPRVLVLARENARATVVESYRGPERGVALVCPVTELVAEAGAVVDHYKLQRESLDAFHLALFHLEAGRGANVSSQTFSLGAAIARHDVQAVLAGEGAEVTLNGLYLVRGRQLADFHMRVDHARAHTTSHELFKGVLDERSRGVFNGRIHVHPQAQKTDAKQTSRNLLLSGEALVNANPQLEIFANDVRCTHGSTVGQLDEQAVFYLRSRGIGPEAARSLLTYAFAADVVERTRVEPLRRELQEFLLAWIPHGEVVREAI